MLVNYDGNGSFSEQRKCPNIDPWGTPYDSTTRSHVTCASFETLFLLLLRYDVIYSTVPLRLMLRVANKVAIGHHIERRQG